MTPQAYVAGRPVASLAKVGNMVLAAEWPDAGIGGPVSAEFEIQLAPQDRPGWLAKDAPADVRFGGLYLLAGKVDEVDWSDDNAGKVTFSGACREGENTACLTAGSLTSSTPNTVIDAAISRGALTWTRPASISGAALVSGDTTDKTNSVTALLAQYADENNVRPYVNASRQLLIGVDPTTPTFLLQPGSGELAWVSEAQATRIVGGWHLTTGGPQITTVGSGAIEKMVDLDPNGLFPDATRPTAILNSILAKATSGGWGGGLTVAVEQIVGEPHPAAVLDAVGKGCMFRLLGQRETRPGRVPVRYVDFVCERVEWNVNDANLTLTPRGMVSRDWTAILAEAGVDAA